MKRMQAISKMAKKQVKNQYLISVWRHAACYEEYVSFCAAVRALGASGVCICVCVFVCVSGCRLFVCFKVQYPSIKLLYNAVFQLCTSS